MERRRAGLMVSKKESLRALQLAASTVVATGEMRERRSV